MTFCLYGHFRSNMVKCPCLWNLNLQLREHNKKQTRWCLQACADDRTRLRGHFHEIIVEQRGEAAPGLKVRGQALHAPAGNKTGRSDAQTSVGSKLHNQNPSRLRQNTWEKVLHRSLCYHQPGNAFSKCCAATIMLILLPIHFKSYLISVRSEHIFFPGCGVVCALVTYKPDGSGNILGIEILPKCHIMSGGRGKGRWGR